MRGYTPEEIDFIKSNIRGRSHAEIAGMFNRRFNRSITIKQMRDFLSNRKLRNGLRGKYPRCYFKRGYKLKSAMAIGSERINPMGYKEIKTAGGVWKSKHRVIWEDANGPVPRGHTVIFTDRNKSNMKPDNLLLVSMGELAVMNRLGLVFTDGDLTRIGKTIADLRLLINARRRGEKKRQED
jgi:hypothetical protein